MTFAQLLARLRRKRNTEATDSDQVQEEKDSLNAAYMEVSGYADWPLLEDSTAIDIAENAVELTLPDDFDRVKALTLYSSDGETEHGILSPTTYENEIAIHGHPTTNATNRPARYTIEGQADGSAGARKARCLIFPYSDDAYTAFLIHHVKPPEMSADADVPWFPSTFHSMLVDMALVELGGDEGGYDTSGAAQRAARKLDNMLFRSDPQNDAFTQVARVGD